MPQISPWPIHYHKNSIQKYLKNLVVNQILNTYLLIASFWFVPVAQLANYETFAAKV